IDISSMNNDDAFAGLRSITCDQIGHTILVEVSGLERQRCRLIPGERTDQAFSADVCAHQAASVGEAYPRVATTLRPHCDLLAQRSERESFLLRNRRSRGEDSGIRDEMDQNKCRNERCENKKQ